MGKLTYGATGLSYECKKVDIRPDGGPRCPRCQDRVYHNEERRLAGQCWHKRCFNCVRCKKGLDSTNCNSHASEVFCNTCHRREFGPKGYGFANGAAGLSSEARPTQLGLTHNSKKTNPPDDTNGNANGAYTMSVGATVNGNRNGNISPVLVNGDNVNGNIVNGAYTMNAAPVLNGTRNGNVSPPISENRVNGAPPVSVGDESSMNGTDMTSPSRMNERSKMAAAKATKMAAMFGADTSKSRVCCPRCDKRVYFAEEVKVFGQSWHKRCFTCGVCRTGLDAGRCNAHDGQVYCQACYGRRFGPKGYGSVGPASQATEDRLSIEGHSDRLAVEGRMKAVSIGGHAYRKEGLRSENSTNGDSWTESVFL